MASPIKELFHLVAGKNSLPSKGSFKAFSIRTAITARFEGRERFLPNKGGGQSGTSRLVENICSSQRQSAQVNLFVTVFPIAPKMVQVWEEKSPE